MTDALFGLLGIVVGASLQFWFNHRANLQARYLELKSTAYADYVHAVAKVPTSPSDDKSQAIREVTSAKARICVFGDSDVVDSLVALEKTSRNLANEDAQSAFKSLLSVMRSRGVAVGKVNEKVFDVLLFPKSN
jgi:hypothetical protein